MSAVKKQATPKVSDVVFGLGATGLSVARYLKRHGIDAVYVDSRSEPPGLEQLHELLPDAEIVLGDGSAVNLEQVRRIIASPGIADSDALLTSARDSGIEVVSDIELFAQEARPGIVAVTGSNGKSTVTTLLALMCDAAGKSALAGANLGVPALDLLELDRPEFYLLELSSFQLQRTKNLAAKVAVLLNVSPDHLDWHESEADYRAAKYRVFENAQAAVINRADPEIAERVGQGVPTVSFGFDAPEDGQYGIREEDGEIFLARGVQLLFAASGLALVGRHNQLNALAALAAGELMGLEMPAMLQVLPEFPGLPHRMQLVAVKRGVAFINDSKATNVGAAVASIESIDGMIVLIAGGQAKGGDFGNLAEALGKRLKAALLIGSDAHRIADALGNAANVHIATGCREAVIQAAEIAEAGDTVLLAPACASFDQFPDYKARGEAFSAAVRELPS